MTQAIADVEALRTAVTGTVVTPDGLDYEQARRVWNADIDHHPAVVVQCGTAQDAAEAIRFAQDQGLELAVRCGAHSMPGYSSVDGGLVIDLGRMNEVTVDPEAKRARVQGGALLRDLDAATQGHELAVPAGFVSHTGVTGLTLGGGMGWLSRKAGLSVDNLVSAEVVVADGRILRAAEDENSDLFWAIRGGGGNFGVVTELEFRLHDVDPVVQYGLLFWDVAKGGQALRLMRDIIVDLPRSLTALPAALTTPPAPFVPPEHHHKLGYALLLVGFGDEAEHRKALEHVRNALPPLFEYVTPMPYVALQQMLDEANAWGLYGYDRGGYFEDLSDEMIDVFTQHMPRRKSPLSVVFFYRLDGAYSEVGDDDTAFGGGRTPRYMAFFIGLSPTPELLPAEREWVRSMWNDLKPYMIGTTAYVNALEGQERDRVRETYGEKYERLAMIKAKYDPQNIFHRNVNIEPALAVTDRS
jgi:FAD/FMN-containing dehydrogenase